MRELWSASTFNSWVAWLVRWSPRSGQGIRLRITRDGTTISAEDEDEFDHPWALRVRWHPDPDNPEPPGGEWRATVTPGFVVGGANLIDAHVTMPARWIEDEPDKRDVPLTDDPTPWLTLDGVRDPIRSAGLTVNVESQQIIHLPGTGYPAYFEKLGARPAAQGGKADDLPFDPKRTRELRAVDVVLRQPRIGTRLDVTPGEPIIDAQVQFLTTLYVNDFLRSTGGRARVLAEPKYVPAGDGQTVPGTFNILLNADDPQFDDRLLATVWFLSPADADFDALPDQSWTPFVQSFTWWNLNHATRLVPPPALQAPIHLSTGIPLADLLANPLLELSNDVLNEVGFAVSQADTRGQFWST